MKEIKYIERRYIDRFSCIDTTKTVKCADFSTHGGLLYLYNSGGYVMQTLDKNFVKSILEI